MNKNYKFRNKKKISKAKLRLRNIKMMINKIFLQTLKKKLIPKYFHKMNKKNKIKFRNKKMKMNKKIVLVIFLKIKNLKIMKII